MIDENNRIYKLTEAGKEVDCGNECPLSGLCDKIADELDNIEFMLCAEEEDFDQFENPIYVEEELML